MSRRAIAGWCVLGVAIIVFAVLTAALSGSQDAPLDPQNPAPGGAQAVAEVLDDQGVDVRIARDPGTLHTDSNLSDATLVITDPTRLSAQTLRDLLSSSARRIVLVDPDNDVLEALHLPATAHTSSGDVEAHDQSCSIPWARGLELSGTAHRYTPEPDAADARTCLGEASVRGGALVTLDCRPGAPHVVLIGSTDVLRNKTIEHADNAAIALRMLGQDPQLVWLAPTRAMNRSIGGPPPWPRWTDPALVILVGAALLIVLWRGRRLGPLVPERLPVVVPANETTRARGQLYRKAKDTERSTAILRHATRERLRTYLGLPPGSPPEAIVEETARVSGRDPVEVHALLIGEPPRDEVTMTTIAQHLTTIERQVRP